MVLRAASDQCVYMIPVALRWMHMEERKAVRIDRELDAARDAETTSSPVILES